jgi:hypothetical protein
MIPTDAFQIVNIQEGGFYATRLEWIEEPRPTPYAPDDERQDIRDVPPGVSPSRWRVLGFFVDEQDLGGVWTEAQVDRFIGERRPPELAGWPLIKVRAPACGCCGRRPPKTAVKPIYPPNRHPAYRDWRCEKHEGRVPCVIAGCGKTWEAGANGYEVSTICGRHWRMAPKAMRDRIALIRKLIKKAEARGKPVDSLWGRHHRMWERCVLEVRRRLEGPAAEDELIQGDAREIAAELERLGL